MSDLRPSRGADAFTVRMPDGMRDRIKLAADLNARSMNAEIIATLEAKYPAQSVDVQAVETVLHYVASAPTPAARAERLQEVNAKFVAIGSPLRAQIAKDGKLSIITQF